MKEQNPDFTSESYRELYKKSPRKPSFTDEI